MSMPPIIDYPFGIAPTLSVKGENLRGRSALSKETGPYIGAIKQRRELESFVLSYNCCQLFLFWFKVTNHCN